MHATKCDWSAGTVAEALAALDEFPQLESEVVSSFHPGWTWLAPSTSITPGNTLAKHPDMRMQVLHDDKMWDESTARGLLEMHDASL